MAVVAKRTSTILYSDPEDYYSHVVRFVLAEKGIAADIYQVSRDNVPQELVDINPYGTCPTLVDRDLALYDATVIMEYLDERFPHPPLLPVYPVNRAQSRLMMYRIHRDWCILADTILNSKTKETAVNKARKALQESILGVAPIFEDKLFFMSDEFTLVDCCIAPLFWRLPKLHIEIPKQGKAVMEYAERIFSRESFQKSLSDVERVMCEFQVTKRLEVRVNAYEKQPAVRN